MGMAAANQDKVYSLLDFLSANELARPAGREVVVQPDIKLEVELFDEALND